MQAAALTPQTTAARSRIRWMFTFAIVGVLVAGAWDGWWHTQYEFDGFFSPPHVFGYAVALGIAWLTILTVLNRDLRLAFGTGFKTFLFPYPVPGPLVLLGGSIVLLGFAGLVLDNFWHTWFGLSETPWSLPHAMIGWSLLLMVLGFTACRMALGDLNAGWRFILGWLVVVTMMGAATGPYGRNPSLAMVQAEAQIPVYAVQEGTRHLFNVYEYHNLTRENAAFMVLAALGGAAGLTFVRRMSPKVWTMLGVALLVSVSGDRNTAERLIDYAPGLLDNPDNYAPIPLIVLAVAYALLRWLRAPEGWAWGIAGVLFAFTLHNRFGVAEGLRWVALLAAPAAVFGARLGTYIYQRVAEPTSWRAVLGLAALGVGLPLLTGLIDLFWRLTTPV